MTDAAHVFAEKKFLCGWVPVSADWVPASAVASGVTLYVQPNFAQDISGNQVGIKNARTTPFATFSVAKNSKMVEKKVNAFLSKSPAPRLAGARLLIATTALLLFFAAVF